MHICLFIHIHTKEDFSLTNCFPPQGLEMFVSSDLNLPHDADGAVDYMALAQLLKDTQGLQEQADILYILFKDKSAFTFLNLYL